MFTVITDAKSIKNPELELVSGVQQGTEKRETVYKLPDWANEIFDLDQGFKEEVTRSIGYTLEKARSKDVNVPKEWHDKYGHKGLKNLAKATNAMESLRDFVTDSLALMYPQYRDGADSMEIDIKERTVTYRYSPGKDSITDDDLEELAKGLVSFLKKAL